MGLVQNFGVCFLLVVELYAILIGLQVSWHIGFNKIILKADSKEAYNVITDPITSGL